MIPRQPGRTPLAVPLVLGTAALLCAVVASAGLGEMRIAPLTVLHAVANRLAGAGFPVAPVQEGIVWDYRLSRALLAACCGGGLAVCGTVLQALLRNPLAEPYVLGVSAGASAGAVAVVLLGWGGTALSMPGGAFLGALAALATVSLVAAGAGGGDRVILAGVAGAQLFNAITAFIVATAANAQQARGIMFWLLGNLSGARWADVALAAPVVAAAAALCLLHARALDAFTFGTDAAAALGIAVGRTRLLLFTLAAAITATLVSMVGSIGFVGLVIPHAARFLVGPTHGRLLPAAFLAGATFTVAADILSRILLPQQTLPIGVVTALFGAPAFVLILLRARRGVV